MTKSGTPRPRISRPEEAVRHLTAAVAVRRGSAVAHRCLGDALVEKGKIDEAIAEFGTAIRLNASYAEAHISLGATLCDLVHDYEGAVAEFRAAIAITPDWAVAHFYLGNALLQQAQAGKPEAMATAIKALERWRADADLAGVRDPQTLNKLPEVERKAWQALRAEVDHFLERAAGKP